jgi:uncharacterized protein YndB with AHSA1/START domain
MNSGEKKMSSSTDGVVTEIGEGLYDLRFERYFDAPIEKVWAALTEPAQISDWLASAKVDLRLGGYIEIHWPVENETVRHKIVAFEPPRLLAFTWHGEEAEMGSVARWELSEDGPGCRLILTNTLLRTNYLLDVATGWHTHLEEFEDCLGRSERLPWRAERSNAFGLRKRKHVARYKTFVPQEAVAHAKLTDPTAKGV